MQWTREKHNTLLRLISEGIPHAQISEQLGCSRSAVHSYTQRHGIRALHHDIWTDEHRAYIRKHYHIQTAAQISAHISHSVGGVRQMATTLGVARTLTRIDGAFLEKLRISHAAGWSDEEIADQLHVERHTVARHRVRLGLPINGVHTAHFADRVRAKTAEQLRQAGLPSIGHLRKESFRQRAIAAGWPEDLRPRAVQMLNAMWDRGPMTRRELAEAIGMRWKGSSASLVSNDPEGTYLASLIKRGLVVNLGRKCCGKGRGHSSFVYSLSPDIQRKFHE